MKKKKFVSDSFSQNPFEKCYTIILPPLRVGPIGYILVEKAMQNGDFSPFLSCIFIWTYNSHIKCDYYTFK